MCRLDGSAWWLAGCRRARLSRRRVLGGAMGTTVGAAMGIMLSACGGGAFAGIATAGASSAPPVTPRILVRLYEYGLRRTSLHALVSTTAARRET